MPSVAWFLLINRLNPDLCARRLRDMNASEPLQNIRQSLHDLAQPLAAVTGLVDLMLLEMDEQDPMLHEVRLISDQLEKVLQIVGEIRRLAREAAGAGGVPRSPRPAPAA